MFDHLIGNQAAKEAITRFITAGRVPNSLLFAGTDGVGKKQFALQLAKSIVCLQAGHGKACGICAACARVGGFKFPGPDAKGEDYDRVFFSDHLDVGMVVPFNRTLRVGSIRALEVEANFRPYEAKARVFIIDEAQRMNAAASNALLKTLEEPPSSSHIFLITSKPNALLPTIRSRVQTLRFGPVSGEQIEHLLLTTHQYSQEDAHLVAFGSNGSVSRAASAKVDDFREVRDLALEILRDAIVHRDLVGVLRLSEKVTAQRTTPEYEIFLDILQGLIHQLWSICIGQSNAHGDDEIAKLASSADASKLVSWLDHIEQIRAALLVNVNKKIVTDDLVVKMAAG